MKRAIDELSESFSNLVYYRNNFYISEVDGKDQEHFEKCSILECLDSIFSNYSATMVVASKSDL